MVVMSACVEKTPAASDKCVHKAIVKDLSGLDGCGYILVLEDGTRLEPVDVEAEDFTFEAGQRVKIGYEIQDGMSTCMAGNMAVIKCIELVKEKKHNK